MGLFGKKDEIVAKLMFFEGELPGFKSNNPCQCSLEDDVLLIKKRNGDTTVKLSTERLLEIEIIGEPQYFEKYKGTTITVKPKEIKREFYVIHYIDKNQDKKMLVFWGVNAFFNMNKIKSKLPKQDVPKEYSI